MCVLNVPGLVPNMTGFSLKIIGFSLNMTENYHDDESNGLGYIKFLNASFCQNKITQKALNLSAFEYSSNNTKEKLRKMHFSQIFSCPEQL